MYVRLNDLYSANGYTGQLMLFTFLGSHVLQGLYMSGFFVVSFFNLCTG